MIRPARWAWASSSSRWESSSHEGHIRRLDGNVAAHGTHGDADIGGGEGGCVVDAVSDHGHVPRAARSSLMRTLSSERSSALTWSEQFPERAHLGCREHDRLGYLLAQ
jgi:hypothetical protein